MTPDEAAALLTYTNQADPLVSLNDANADIWWEALKRQEFAKAQWCIKDYYANTAPGRDGRIPPITPGVLRHRIGDKAESVESRQRALEPAPKHKTPDSYRERNPEEWERLFKQGRDKHHEKLWAKGHQPHTYEGVCRSCNPATT